MRTQPDFDPRDAEIAMLRSVIGQAMEVCAQRFNAAAREHGPVRTAVVDFAADLRLVLSKAARR